MEPGQTKNFLPARICQSPYLGAAAEPELTLRQAGPDTALPNAAAALLHVRYFTFFLGKSDCPP